MFQNGPRGSAPAPKPPPRPAPSIPIRTLVNPVSPARPSGGFAGSVAHAIARAAPAVTRAAYSASTPHTAPRRGAGPIAQTIARKGAASASRGALASRITDFYFRQPTSRFGEYADYKGSQGFRNSMYQSYFDQVFRNLQTAGLVPKSAKEPSLSFPAPETNKLTDTGASYAQGQHITISPLAVAGVASPMGALFGGYGKETAVHELAHTLQRPALMARYPADKALVEGGAQAFADAASFAAGTGPIPQQDGSYSGFVDQVRRLGPQWYMRGQFGGPQATRRRNG